MIEVKKHGGKLFYNLHGDINFDGVCPSSYQEVATKGGKAMNNRGPT